MAKSSSGWSWAWIHGWCHERDDKARCEDKKRECEQFNRTSGERLFTFHYKRSTLGRERDRQNGWRGFQKLFQVWIVKWPGWLERDLSMQSTKSRLTQRVKPPIQDLLAWKIREETLQRMWSTSLQLVSWKVVKKRATDHVRSLKVHGIEGSTVNKG